MFQSINNSVIEQVHSFKYLGIKIDCTLKMNEHVDNVCVKLAQRLFVVSGASMWIFLHCSAGKHHTVWYGCMVWVCHCPPKNRLGGLVKVSMKVMGKGDFPSLQFIYERAVARLTKRSLSTLSRVLFTEFLAASFR